MSIGLAEKIGVDDFLANGGAVGVLEAIAVAADAWLAANAAADEPEVGLVKELADTIAQAEHFAQDAGRKLFRFAGGVYKPHGAEWVKKTVKDLLEAQNQTAFWSSHLANEVVEYLRVGAPQLWEEPPLDVINIQNGLLNVVTRELSDHDPAHLSPVQLPVVYDPDASCPVWDRFIGEVFPEDAQDLAFEIAGYLMVPDTAVQKAILLLGDGGNGKSTYLRGLGAFLGRKNVSALSLHKLESDRFAVARLQGKLANIAADLPSEHLAGTSVFKALTGGDELTGEYKYVDSFDFTPFVRLVFSANHAPHSGDASQGFFDRWIVVPFARTFRGTGGEIPRPVLDARLAAPAELSGLLNQALVGLARIREGHRFTDAESLRQAANEFRESTDPVAVWLGRATVAEPEVWVLKGTLYQAYADAARKEGVTPLTANAFGRALGKLRPGIGQRQRTVAGRPQWTWIGIGLRGDAPTDPGGSRQSRDSRDSLSVTPAPSATSFWSGNGREAEASRGTSALTVVESRESRDWREPSDPGCSNDDPTWEEGVL